jgi:UDP-N-acetylmuramate--alanine ligase
MKKSFKEFADRIDKNGYLIACYDDLPTREVAEQVKCNVIYYGENNKELDYSCVDVQIDDMGKPSYELYIRGKKACDVKLDVNGRHNALNSLAVIAVLDILGADVKEACGHLAEIPGAKRRFDLTGEAYGVKVFTDYAHHPTEIDVTLETASKMKHRKLYAAFEPHTFSRVKVLFDQFAHCFRYADFVIMADIYNDRETTDKDVSSELLTEAINAAGTEAIYLPTYKEIEDYFYDHVQEGDIVMILGSKYLECIAKPLFERLQKK